jgi:hypothetical protein
MGLGEMRYLTVAAAVCSLAVRDNGGVGKRAA